MNNKIRFLIAAKLIKIMLPCFFIHSLIKAIKDFVSPNYQTQDLIHTFPEWNCYRVKIRYFQNTLYIHLVDPSLLSHSLLVTRTSDRSCSRRNYTILYHHQHYYTSTTTGTIPTTPTSLPPVFTSISNGTVIIKSPIFVISVR